MNNRITKKCLDLAFALKPKIFSYYHVSFILHKNKVLSIGINNPRKTHPRNLKLGYLDRFGKDISDLVGVHSELSSIIRLGETDCKRYKLVNIRIDKHNEITNSCPCEGCMNLIKQVGFKEVWYSKDGDFFKL